VRGYDSAKHVNGRKRHVLVDTLGLVLIVLVTEADMQDRDGAKRLLVMLLGLLPRLRKLWADGAYRGALVDWVKQFCRLDLEIVERDPAATGFQVLPRRWVVERTFAWLNHCRRLSKDYEYLPSTSEAMVYVAMVRLTTRRLATRT
jgi:putative transposase